MKWTSYANQVRRVAPMIGIKPDEATIRTWTTKDKKPRLLIRLGLDVLKKAKLTLGDTVDLLANDDKTQALIKKAEKGWKLAKSGKNAAEFNLPWGENALFAFTAKKAVKLEPKFSDGGLVFQVPKGEA